MHEPVFTFFGGWIAGSGSTFSVQVIMIRILDTIDHLDQLKKSPKSAVTRLTTGHLQKSRDAVRARLTHLLTSGCGIGGLNDGEPILLLALKGGDASCLRPLLHLGADPLNGEEYGCSPLGYAMRQFLTSTPEERVHCWQRVLTDLLTKCNNTIHVLWTLVGAILATEVAENDVYITLWRLTLTSLPDALENLRFHSSLCHILRDTAPLKIEECAHYFSYSSRNIFSFHPLDVLVCVCVVNELWVLLKCLFYTVHVNSDEVFPLRSLSCHQKFKPSPTFQMQILAELNMAVTLNWEPAWSNYYIYNYTVKNIHLAAITKLCGDKESEPLNGNDENKPSLSDARSWVSSQLSTPRYLLSICRKTILRHLPPSSPDNVTYLGLPSALKQYLLFEDLSDI